MTDPFSTTTNVSLVLRQHVEQALAHYFQQYKDHIPGNLYELVINGVEQPLLELVLKQVEYNQSHAARLLGINRATLSKKMRLYGLTEQAEGKS
jgi:Fis family transcriptional regulator, factor for inversion stimulation protein